MRLSILVLFGTGGVLVMQESTYNNELLEYLLDDLMPWHREEGLKDFSLLEVNRYDIMFGNLL